MALQGAAAAAAGRVSLVTKRGRSGAERPRVLPIQYLGELDARTALPLETRLIEADIERAAAAAAGPAAH